jgi:phosphohistidine phosphatase
VTGASAAPDLTLYLVRHAIAAERGPAWPDDDRRPLTHRGIARMREIAAGLRALGVRPAVVATSPLERASQTASLLAAGLKPAPEVVVVPALSPGHAPAQVAEALGRLDRVSSLAVVGHEPDLGELAAWLTGARVPPPFRKGGVCRLDLRSVTRPRSAALVWMATPKMLRALSRT